LAAPRPMRPDVLYSRSMNWRRIALLAALAVLAAPAGAAQARSVSQVVTGVIDATNVHMRSTLERVSPIVPNVTWHVIDLNDEIELINHSSKLVTVYGYDGDQYLRIYPNGTVQLNENSPAYYLNQSFFAGGVKPPSYATANATPNWVIVSKTASFIWHDHRIHWYAPGVPYQVKNVHKTTFIQNWTVPFEVGAVKGALYGKLVWIGEKPLAFPIGAIIAFIAILLAGAGFVIVVRRRRAAAGTPPASW
jgi:hypothetical protein